MLPVDVRNLCLTVPLCTKHVVPYIMLTSTCETELQDLPNELLLQILKDLSKSDLYSISFHSPRLHSLAISMNLSHHGIFDEEFAAISEECGLQLTNYIQTTALLCIMLLAFSESIFEAAFGIGGKDEGICNPEVLMKRLSCIRHITLDFDTSVTPLNPTI
jgi:hypothetical protein